jgi:hypothetical protein
VKLLTLMKPDEASAILEAMGKVAGGAKRAAALTDMMRRVLPPSSTAKPARSP